MTKKVYRKPILTKYAHLRNITFSQDKEEEDEWEHFPSVFTDENGRVVEGRAHRHKKTGVWYQ